MMEINNSTKKQNYGFITNAKKPNCELQLMLIINEAIAKQKSEE